MTTRAVLMSVAGNVHRVLIQNDGSDGTACGVLYGAKKLPVAPVRPVQALVYHLHGCQAPDCWKPGQWKLFVEGALK